MLVDLASATITWIYLTCALVLAIYALHAYAILTVLLRHGRRAALVATELAGRGRENLATRPLPTGTPAAGHGTTGQLWPFVATQIPLYNEANVAERVLRAVAAMHYPGRHLIQVLDDSTDETTAIVDRVAADLRTAGHDIDVVRRPTREGFKAGALAEGLRRTGAELIAVFDADFVPKADFLLQTVPCFQADPRIGFVQGRWTFLNERDSVLTRAQGVGLDSHFAIEQAARGAHPGMCINFNGTAGVWRRQSIDEGGGWSAATLTEDLDLSYRVQLAGWRGLFLPHLEVPGELPATFSGFKSQQFRWAKGSMQTAVRLLPRLWRSTMPLSAKVEGSFHLTHYAVHPLLLLVILLGPLVWLSSGDQGRLPGLIGTLLLVAAFAPTVFYGVGQYRLHRDWPRRLLRLPALTLAGMGLAAANARAIAEALLNRTSAFIRTPKSGDGARLRYSVRFPIPPWIEVVVGAHAAGGALLAWQAGNAGAVTFGLLCAASMFYIGLGSLAEIASNRRRQRPDPRGGTETANLPDTVAGTLPGPAKGN